MMKPDIALNEVALIVGGKPVVVRVNMRLLVHIEAEYGTGFLDPLNEILKQLADGGLPSRDAARMIQCCLKSAGSDADALDMVPSDAMAFIGELVNGIVKAMTPANPAEAVDEPKAKKGRRSTSAA